MTVMRRASFVVRVVADRQGQLSGVIERPATGAKEAFTGQEAVGGLIAQMLERERPVPPAGFKPDGRASKDE